jgi:hypothetical protein
MLAILFIHFSGFLRPSIILYSFSSLSNPSLNWIDCMTFHYYVSVVESALLRELVSAYTKVNVRQG